MNMKIGIVCEGQTDLVAIEAFFSCALYQQGITASFIRLQPTSDNTQEPAGWSHVLHWLENNPPEVRRNQYLGGGLFANNLSAQSCDLILFQFDTDIIQEASFVNFIAERGLNLGAPVTPIDKGSAIFSLFTALGNFVTLTDDEKNQHVVAPAVDSTETWCIAASQQCQTDPESFTEHQIRNKFGATLALFLGEKTQQNYATINKRVPTRKRLCDSIADTRLLMNQCHHFKITVDKLVNLAK